MHVLTDLDADQSGCNTEPQDHIHGFCDNDATLDHYSGRDKLSPYYVW